MPRHSTAVRAESGDAVLPEPVALPTWLMDCHKSNASCSGLRLPTDGSDRLGKRRFVAQNAMELYSSIFAWWDILDALMLKHNPSTPTQTGYLREIQLRALVAYAQALGSGSVYCEVGMNGGHSTVAVLLANPNITVDSFDMMFWGYSKPVASLLETSFSGRLRFHKGNSHSPFENATVPQAVLRGLRCDLILVDGDHGRSGAALDMRNLKPAATAGSVVMIDDIFLHGSAGPGGALRDLERSKTLRVLQRHGPYEGGDMQNPCMRSRDPAGAHAVRGRGLFCVVWGYAIAQYSVHHNYTTQREALREAL